MDHLVECDICGVLHPQEERLYMCQPRPSDKSCLCCIMYTCTQCTRPTKWCNTREGLDEYFDSGEAAKDGFLFLEV